MGTLTALLTAFLLVLTSSLYTQNDFKLGFTGAYPHNYNNPVTLQHDWGWYNDLKMNTWSGWWMGGNWGTSATGTQSVLSRFASYDINGYLQPDTIRWAGYGRVQVNEAELDDDLRFRYGNHHSIGRNIEETWQGTTQKVRFYEVIPTESPALVPVLTEVKENCFQSIANFPYDPKYQVDFPFNVDQNDPYNSNSTKYPNNYYILPKMRINSNEVSVNRPVVKVVIKAFDGFTTVLERTINTVDFKTDGVYDGSYKEDFSNLNMSVPGDIINTGRGEVFVPTPDVLANCHVDYQIYWYGEVNVWIDYVKVMDEAAYMINNPDPCKRWRFEHLLQKPLN